jgi:predicted nuclease of restriction endonuclease-like RecB superfamily
MPHVPLSNLGPGIFAPAYLGSADLPWLRALLDEADRFRGRPRAELEARLGEPLPFEVSPWKVRLSGRVLLTLEGRPARPKVPSRSVRRVVFGEAARGGGRDEVLARAAGALGLGAGAVDEALYADLPSRRPVPALGVELGPVELAQRVNLALVQALVARTRSLSIRAIGGARDLVRHAKREGLLCTVFPAPEAEGYRLDVSGPLALFRKTAMYARALAGLVPRLSWCRRYALEAVCETDRGTRTVLVRSGDPIAPSREPLRFDSKLEERFARDFARLAPDWDVVREPEPVPVGGTLVFPDFALVSRVDPRRLWMLEIVGFWTPGYLAQKLERLRALDAPRLVVCVDRDRACAAEELPAGARVVRFRRRIDPRDVLAALEGRFDHGQ